MATQFRWGSFLKKFSKIRVLVIGDMMLDQYVMGRVSRISPEAPVPVVDVQSEKSFPGGASNVARNLRSLSSRVEVVGVIGADIIGKTLVGELEEQGIGTHGLLRDSSRPTTLKTRIIAQHQQVVRFDKESRRPMSPSMKRKALKWIQNCLKSMDAVIFEDYGKGFIDQDFLDECMILAKKAGILTFADPNAHHHLNYRGLDGITPNRSEAFWMAHISASEPASDPLQDSNLIRVGNKLLEETQTVHVLITLGEQGMCLFRKGHKPHHIPTAAQEVFDVSGAGDTAISAFTLGLCSGMDPVQAAYLSNQASGIVVGKAGTATVTIEELIARL